MPGYWLVVAMTLVALISVVLVFLGQPDAPAPANAPGQLIRVAVLGASDVTGEGLARPHRENWVAQLGSSLPAGVEVRPFGIGGSWLASAESSLVPQARAWNPDIVVCWLVVNDLTQGEGLAAYSDRLGRVLTNFQADGAIVLIGNAPQLWTLPAFAGDADDERALRQEVERWNTRIDEVAAAQGASVVDLSASPVSPADVLADGLHPNLAGHARLAAEFTPAVIAAIDRVQAVRLNAADTN